MRNNSYKGEILFVLISTFIVTVIWVGSDIYNKSVTSTLDKTLKYQTIPIQPSFDMKTIEKIRARSRVSPNFNTPPQTPSASEEGELSSTPEPDLTSQIASGGGDLGL